MDWKFYIFLYLVIGSGASLLMNYLNFERNILIKAGIDPKELDECEARTKEAPFSVVFACIMMTILWLPVLIFFTLKTIIGKF